MANRYISKHSPDYPVGRSRLEALSVMACAFIMSMASIEGEEMTDRTVNYCSSRRRPSIS